MTLIGAFKCTDGAVMFADGQETIPNYAKFEVDKLYYFEAQGRFRVLMTAAGQSDAIDMLWDGVASALRAGDDLSHTEEAKHAHRSITLGPVIGTTEIKKLITDTVAKFTKEVFLPWPDPSRTVGAIWLVQRLNPKSLKSIQVFRTNEFLVNAVEHYYFTGTPLLLTRYLADSYLENVMLTVEEAQALAAFLLWEAKAYDTDVGKQSDIIIVRENGDIRWVLRPEVAYWEEHFALYKKWHRIIPSLTCSGELFNSVYDPNEHIGRFIEAIKFLASEQKKMRQCGGAFGASLEGRLINKLRKKKKAKAKRQSASRKSKGQQ